MTTPRRYSDTEVRHIMRVATDFERSSEQLLQDDASLTLDELVAIGTELGIDRGRIIQAARGLDAPTSWRERMFPIEVSRTISFNRIPTDEEWGIVVAELRETFAAPGKLYTDGVNREWNSGGTRAWLEPTRTGYRVRIWERKGSSIIGAAAASAVTAWSILMAGGLALTGDLATGYVAPLVTAVGGIAGITWSIVSARIWARGRRAKMDRVADEAAVLLDAIP